MGRLPYGTFKTLTPEQQREHMRALSKNAREKNRDKINAYNKTFFDRWKIEKPFVCTCKYCGSKFNAPRNNRYMCPHCHEEKHRIAELKRIIIKLRRDFKKNRTLMIINLAKQGMSQREISKTVQVDQRTVSAICLKKGLRRNKYVSRIK
jgi:hypothetical protein